MSTFLYIALGALAGVVLTPLLLWFALKLFLKGFAKKLIEAIASAGGGAPPFRLELEPIEEHEWRDAKQFDRLTTELEKRGFVRDGDYMVASLPPVAIRGFANPEKSYYAVFYDWPINPPATNGVVADLVAIARGDAEKTLGRGFTVTNAPETGLDQPPWSEKASLDVDLNNPRVALDALLGRIDEMTAGQELLPANPELFAPTLRSAYAREMDWQVERGGLQREEIVRNLITMQGLEEDDENIDEVVEQTQTQWREAISEFVSDKTRERFLRHMTKMSAGEWEDARDRLVIVHERLVTDDLIVELAHTMIRAVEIDEDDDSAYDAAHEEATEKIEAAFANRQPRAGFEAALELMPAGIQYKRLARIKSPWPADVYLEPEEDD